MVEAMTRHAVALADLIELAGDPSLLVIAADWGKYDLFGAWSRKVFPDSWLWLKWRDAGDEEGDPFTYFWVTPISTLPSLIGPLERVVEEQGHVYVTDAGMNWIYSPYDGGADIYSTSTSLRLVARRLSLHSRRGSRHPRRKGLRDGRYLPMVVAWPVALLEGSSILSTGS